MPDGHAGCHKDIRLALAVPAGRLFALVFPISDGISGVGDLQGALLTVAQTPVT